MDTSFAWATDTGEFERCLLGNIFRLRLISRRWSTLVAEAFFSNSMIVEHIDSRFENNFEYDGESHCHWFVPYRGTHAITDSRGVVRYQVRLKEGWSHDDAKSLEVELICVRDVLMLGPGRDGTITCLSLEDDAKPLDKNCFVGSDVDHGLQVRGYWFYANLKDVPRLSKSFQDQIRFFIWTLMERPDDVPKVNDEYVLHLPQWTPWDTPAA